VLHGGVPVGSVGLLPTGVAGAQVTGAVAEQGVQKEAGRGFLADEVVLEQDVEVVLHVADGQSGERGRLVDVEPEEWERVISVNLLGTAAVVRAALPFLTETHGRVVTVASSLAIKAVSDATAYCASKFGARGFTEAVTAELLHAKSRVRLSEVDMPAFNTIQFNWVKSQLPHHPQPVPPIYEPEVGAIAIADVADILVGHGTTRTSWAPSSASAARSSRSCAWCSAAPATARSRRRSSCRCARSSSG